MNEVIKNIKTRRSIKQYKSDMIPQELIDIIVESGTYAPSGMNKQSAIIIEITNKEIRDKLAKINAEIGNMSIDPFYNAPIVLAVLADKSIPTYIYDGSLVMANMMLASHSLQIGSCWIHRAKETFEHEVGKQILKDLNIVGDYEGIGFCILGYYEKEVIARPRKENYIYKIQ